MKSHVIGATDQPLIETTIGVALDRAARKWGEREALVVPAQNVRLSWRELHQRVEELALGFLQQGMEPGDRVGIWSMNRVEWALTQFAAAKAGLVLVTLNPAYRLSELKYVLNKVECKAIVLSAKFKTSDYPGMIQQLAPELATSVPGELSAKELPALKLVVQMGTDVIAGAISFSTLEDQGAEADRSILQAVEAGLSNEDAVNVQFTSGTTGSPKGVTLSHRNILNNGYFVGSAMNITPEDRICVPVPLYHCFGMVMGNLAGVSLGAAVVYPGEGFDPEMTLKTVSDEKCTALYGVPTMFIAELDSPTFGSFDLSTLRTGIMAGSPCPIEIMRKVVDRMNMQDVTIAYGMTETSPVSFQTTENDPLERRVSTVGRVHPHVECKVIDEAGETVPAGTSGELCTRGYSAMIGYWGESELTAETKTADGWIHTGDLATIDADGYCNIVGRIKDMVIRGGENLYPREIEEFLYTHPQIQDVQIFGVPDEKFGEELCAWIILSGEEDLNANGIIAYCSGQIAHHKIPKHIRFVEEFPMTVTGKIQKFIMREEMIKELALFAPVVSVIK